MLSRNNELKVTLAIAGGITILSTLGFGFYLSQVVSAYLFDSSLVFVGCAWIALTSAVLIGIFSLFTAWRYRQLKSLAARIDEALHSRRTISFINMSEGELAILANEIDKAFSRLYRTNEALEHERAFLANSLADISHQLRTPLTSLGLTLALARKDAKDLTDVSNSCAMQTMQQSNAQTTLDKCSLVLANHLRVARQLIDQIQWLVESLLTLARTDADAITLQHDPVNVLKLIDLATASFEIACELSNIQLSSNIDPTTSFIGDEKWTAEALENILKNCLEHTSPGGTISIHASQDTLACRIRITDTGTGFDPDDLPHVFERFYRGKQSSTARNASDTASSKPAFSGVGIGLALAQSLIVAQGGRITASNRTNPDGSVIGACFDITFFKSVV